MSYEATNLTLTELNEKHRILRRPNIQPSELPQAGEWNGKGEAISPTLEIADSVRENGREAHVGRVRINHPPIEVQF